MKNLKAGLVRFHKRDYDPLSVVTRIFRGHFVRDRFNLLNKYSPFCVSEQADEIPTPFTEKVPFADLMDARAQEIVANKERIAVSWSGGVDSTGIVTAILKNLPENERDRLTVLCSNSSLEEAPNYYKLLMNMGIDVRITDNLFKTLGDVECDVALNGFVADQLFGSEIYLEKQELYNAPWMDGVSAFVEDRMGMPLSEKSKSVLHEIYTDYAQKVGIHLEQWCEFAWMINFCCKYSWVQDLLPIFASGSPNQDKLELFYDTMDFQRFAITRQDEIRTVNCHTHLRHYKRPIKQYIFNFAGDQDYLLRKGKMNSLINRTGSRRYNENVFSLSTDSGIVEFPMQEGETYGQARKRVSEMFRKENQ